MDITDQILQLTVIQPAYNIVIWVYANLGYHHAGITTLLLGILSAGIFIPLMISGYFDQQRTRQLRKQIQEIQATEPDQQKQQQKILELLKRKQIHFQSESIFLGGIALITAYFYPMFSQYWSELHPDLLYSFNPAPKEFSPLLGNINLAYSSAELSLLPAILLFFELRQSYKEQQFLTSFIDRWYAVLLPLFVYFLIFWLPSALSLMLTGAIGLSLYLRFLLQTFTKIRESRNKSGQKA